MKITVVGRETAKVREALEKNAFTITKNPEVVISYGGDGTLLHAERDYPGIPKLAFRDPVKCAVCKKKETSKIHLASAKVYCMNSFRAIAKRLKERKFKIRECRKIEATAFVRKNGRIARRNIVGLNEVQVHNSNHIHAVRFDFQLNGKKIHERLIGDGAVAATAFGSTGYFYAITGHKFAKGFGIAFNNSMTPAKTIYPKGEFKAKITIHRRNAMLISDNNPVMIALQTGDWVEIKPSRQKAKLIEF